MEEVAKTCRVDMILILKTCGGEDMKRTRRDGRKDDDVTTQATGMLHKKGFDSSMAAAFSRYSCNFTLKIPEHKPHYVKCRTY